MIRTRWAVAVVVLVLLAACRGHESVTGSYGTRVVTGQVTMADSSTPAGVRLSVAGVGITTVLSDDGRFALSGVPDDAQLVFVRESDGIQARYSVPANATALQIELAQSSARSGRSRAVSPLPPYLQFEGTVKAVSATSITVADSHKLDVTLAIDAKTVIRRGDQSLTAADVQSGDRVHVKATVVGDQKTAVEITLQGGAEEGEQGDRGGQTMTANGTVTATGSASITVSTEGHGEVVVRVGAQTIIKKQGLTIALGDIHVGDGVNTRGTRVDDHTEDAQQIEVRGSGHH